MADHSLSDSRTQETVIREHLVVRGGIVGKGHVTVAGFVEGNIDTKGTVTIQPHGRIKGDILAHDVLVSGHVEGNIHTTGKLTIKETGRVNGDVRTPSIFIAEGAEIIGKLTVEGARKG